MKTINEYINEGLINEAQKINVGKLLKDLDKIEDWNSANNIKNLTAEYMSAGDAEELDSKHWGCCVEAVDYILELIRNFIDENSVNVINIGNFCTTKDDISVYVYNEVELYDHKFLDKLDRKDPEGEWDVDVCFNLFNMVSQKVCKQSWLEN